MNAKILYFMAGRRPTNYDRQVAARLNASVSFRNIYNVKEDDPAESCDGVAGVSIPPQYKNKPTAKEAIASFTAKKSVAPVVPLEASSPVLPSSLGK